MIVVTGAAGFIGSYIVGKLNREGFKDIVLVDKYDDPLKMPNYQTKTYSEMVDRDNFFDWLSINEKFVQIIIHMSEYQEKFSVTRLIGSPPGYVGYEEGGQLTEAVRRKPYSVILFDECEKAHPDVFNVLLQVLDDGRLTDNKGRIVNFKNTIIIMTSNLGSHLIQERFEQMTEHNRAQIEEQTRSDLFDMLRKTISPEFLNRVDEVIMFTPLTRKDIRNIVKLQFNLILQRIPNNQFSIEITEAAIDWLAAVGYDPTHGARPVKRMLQKYLINDLSKEILSGRMENRAKVKVDVENDDIVFRYE